MLVKEIIDNRMIEEHYNVLSEEGLEGVDNDCSIAPIVDLTEFQNCRLLSFN